MYIFYLFFCTVWSTVNAPVQFFCALCLWAHLHICKLGCFNNEEEYIEFDLYSPLCHIMPRFAVWEENTIYILLLNCNRVIHFLIVLS